MAEGGLRIIEETQSNPFARFEPMLTRNVVSELPAVMAIGAERPASDDPPFDPPGFGIAHQRRVAWNFGEDGARLRVALKLAVITHECILNRQFLAHRCGEGVVFFLSAAGAPDQSLGRGGGFLIVPRQGLRCTHRRIRFLAVDQCRHSLAVIIARQQRAEFGLDLALERGVEDFAGPHLAYELVGGLLVAASQPGAGKGELSLRTQWYTSGEMFKHRRSRCIVKIERVFGALEQRL